MSTEEEIDILQKAIVEFHSERPHSKPRKEILLKTVSKLQKITNEPSNHWNRTKVRTWFWNHRDEVPQFYSGKRKTSSKHIEPPTKKQKTNKPPLQTPIKQNEINDSDKTDTDSDIEIIENSGNNAKLVNFAPDTVNGALTYLQPNFIQTFEFIKSSIKFYRIFTCRAIGPDKSKSERWITPTRGSLCFLNDKGRISWKHDSEFNTFSGKLSSQVQSLHINCASNASCRYSMYGKVGSKVMKNKNSYKDSFYCCFRVVSSTEVDLLNNDTKQRRLQDVKLFGNDYRNSEQEEIRYSLKTGDLVGELQFNSAAGRLCGVSISAKPVSVVPDLSVFSFSEKSVILRTLQDALLEEQHKTII